MTTSRIISWQQLVLENDPDWIRNSLYPRVWEFSNGRVFTDTVPLYSFTTTGGLINDGGFLVPDGTGVALPTTDPLQVNAIYANGNFLTMSSAGSTPQVGLSLFWPVTLDQILLIGGAGIATVAPAAGTSQLFLNGNFICVA